MIAFGIEAKNAESVIDQVNEVANNFSVSTGDLSQALGIVASTSSAMGNSLSETIGLTTAITEQTKNAAKSARSVNSIMSSLAQILDDASSNGKKITQIFNELGVAMYDSNGQLLSGFELTKGLAQAWPTLDKNTQTYIATTIAGTNQLNSFLA